MASITVRRLKEDVKRKLRQRAARNGHSMEEEARTILAAAVTEKPAKPKTGADLFAAIRRRFAPLGGVEIPEMPPDYDIDVPDFK